MITIHLVGGPRDGTTVTTSDCNPKHNWFFEHENKLHEYLAVRYIDVEGNPWWVGIHESLDNEQAIHLFTENFYVPFHRRRNRPVDKRTH